MSRLYYKTKQTKKHWIRCLGPLAVKNPKHGFWAIFANPKFGICEKCRRKIDEMHLSKIAEYPHHGEPE